METKNIDAILAKYGRASITIQGGWQKRYIDGYPQIGERVIVKSHGETVYEYDSLRDPKFEKNADESVRIVGSSLYYEIANRYNGSLTVQNDCVHPVRFFSGTVILERKEAE